LLVHKEDTVYKIMDGQNTLLYMDYEKSWVLGNVPKKMTVRRGGPSGKQIGLAEYHDWSSSKVDMEIHGRSVHFRKRFDSQTGLGRLEWGSDYVGDILRSGQSLKLEADGQLIARFTTGNFTSQLQGYTKPNEQGKMDVMSMGKHHLKTMLGKVVDGKFDFQRPGLTMEQIEEIVISGIVERERKQREKKASSAAGSGGDIGGLLGGVGA
jgi:hypothetical protein